MSTCLELFYAYRLENHIDGTVYICIYICVFSCFRRFFCTRLNDFKYIDLIQIIYTHFYGSKESIKILHKQFFIQIFWRHFILWIPIQYNSRSFVRFRVFFSDTNNYMVSSNYSGLIILICLNTVLWFQIIFNMVWFLCLMAHQPL